MFVRSHGQSFLDEMTLRKLNLASEYCLKWRQRCGILSFFVDEFLYESSCKINQLSVKILNAVSGSTPSEFTGMPFTVVETNTAYWLKRGPQCIHALLTTLDQVTGARLSWTNK